MNSRTSQPQESQNPQHLLPPNATPLERAAVIAALKTIQDMPQGVARSLWNANTCPVDLLPWLAWTFGVETWSNEWSAAVKRSRIKEAIAIARHKGTIGGVRKMLASYGATFVIKEWWQMHPKGEPHTFELILTLSGQDGAAASAAFLESVIDDLERTKPVRSHYKITQGLQVGGSLHLLGVGRVIQYKRFKMQAH